MMKLKIFFTFFIFSFLCNSQEIEATLIDSKKLNTDQFIGIDDLGNAYHIKNNTLIKQTKTKVLTFANIELGHINSVNIFNPFKIIVFYRDFNAIVVLDNQLNPLTDIIKINNFTVGAVSYSSENNLWIYNIDNNTLHLYDYQKKENQIYTPPLSTYLDNFKPEYFIGNNREIWMSDPQTGIINMNQYGNFIEERSIKNAHVVFPYKNGLITFDENNFNWLNNNQSTPIKIDITHTPEAVYFNKGLLYIYHNNELKNYQLNL